MTKSNLTAFIFARGGSKGIKDKNIVDFNGIPLIAKTINQAKGVKRINRVIVSTDSDKIAKIAKSFGAGCVSAVIIPSPPAFETAATNSENPTKCIPP